MLINEHIGNCLGMAWTFCRALRSMASALAGVPDETAKVQPLGVGMPAPAFTVRSAAGALRAGFEIVFLSSDQPQLLYSSLTHGRENWQSR